MSVQEFWNEDPDLLWVYRNSYLKKQEQYINLQKEMINFQTWLQGFYNQRAIASNFNEKIKYFDKPIELNLKTKSEKEKKLEIAQRIKNNINKGKIILEQQRSEKKG